MFGGDITPSDKFKKMVVVNNISVRPITRQTQDVDKWRNALQAAEGFGQQRQTLYDLYADILLDGFLKRCIEKRITAVTNRRLCFTVNEKRMEDVEALTDKTFFDMLVRLVMESRFWGHSLIELDWGRDGKGHTKLVDRRHVKPRFGIVTKNSTDTDGIKYREKPFDALTIEAGEDEDLGWILECCFPVIVKRGNYGNWAEFAQVFGMPFRHGKYNNEETRTVLEDALDKMGAAGYIVSPDDAQIEFQYPAGVGQGVDIFKMLHQTCDEDIAITILGNTMTTTEAKTSGYAQGVVHQQVQEELHKDDRKFVLSILNEKLTPYLERIGFPVAGGSWAFEEEENMSKKEMLELGEILKRNAVPVGLSWWYETSGIPMPSADDLPEEDEPEEIEEEEEEAKPKPSK